jgi:REP element-mobilizing transposase RayT
MSTYTQITYQIVFATRNRIRALTHPNRKELLAHIGGILRNKKCHNYAVNGVEDHIHICCSLHPTVALSIW